MSTKQRKAKFGVIGCGTWGENHCNVYKDLLLRTIAYVSLS